MFNIISNLPGWAKITGVSTVVGLVSIFVFLIFISQQPGGDEVISVPSDLKQVKDEVIGELKDAHEEATVNIVGDVVGTFNQAGKDIAKDIEDPLVRWQTVFLMTFAGLMLAVALVIAISKPFVEIIKTIGQALPV